MTISKKIRTIALESLDKVHDVDAKIKKLESERDLWHKSGYEAQMNALRAERQNLIFEANHRLDAAKASYAERLKKLYTPTAEALTVPDRAVLDSGISLTKRDIEELFDRNANKSSCIFADCLRRGKATIRRAMLLTCSFAITSNRLRHDFFKHFVISERDFVPFSVRSQCGVVIVA